MYYLRRLFLFVLLFFIASTQQCLAEFNLREFTGEYEKAVIFITTYNENGSKKGSGSGFFISPEGDFITNRHVLRGAAKAIIETQSGEKYTLNKLKPFNSDTDLAIVSIDKLTEPVPYLHIAEQLPAKGEKVVAFGNPFGIKFSVSEGIVSGIQTFPNSEFPTLTNYKGTYIQFTAPVSPGSSGGPLLNENGQVVGVTTWGFASFASQNLNFAIPASEILNLIELKKNKKPESEKNSDVEKKKQVGFIIMYSPAVLNTINEREHLDDLTKFIEDSLLTKFRPSKNILGLNNETLPLFEMYWQSSNDVSSPVQVYDVDKETLEQFGAEYNFDTLVFIGVDLPVMKKVKSSEFGSVVRAEIEVDFRVLNLSQKEYSFSKIFVESGSDSSRFTKLWGYEPPKTLKPIMEAMSTILKSFRRGFSGGEV